MYGNSADKRRPLEIGSILQAHQSLSLMSELLSPFLVPSPHTLHRQLGVVLAHAFIPFTSLTTLSPTTAQSTSGSMMKEFLYPDHPLLAAAYYGFALLASYVPFWLACPMATMVTTLLSANFIQKQGRIISSTGPNKLVFASVAALRAQDRQLHRVRRQLIGQAISERSMRIFEPNMLEQVDIFLRRVLKSTQTRGPVPNTIDMTESARLLGFDLAALLAFGYNLHLQTKPDNSFILPMLEAGFFWSSVFIHWPLTRKFSLGLALLTVFRRLRSQYLSLVQNIISSRIKQDKNAHHDLYSIVADHLDQSKPDCIRQSELWAEATSFLPAGMLPYDASISPLSSLTLVAGDTTKTALASIFFYLSRNPQCYNNLANEIRAKFTSGREIRGLTLADCHYLRACIDEALRMSPPVPGILWREGYADRQPFMVDGHIIPPGVVVGVNIYSVHYDEEYFPKPFNFRPERWLDNSKTMSDAFMPFSTGPRGCAGKAMAYLELSLVVAKTLWYFDFEPAPNVPGETQSDKKMKTQVFELSDNFTASHDGPYLVFKPRENLYKDFYDVHGEL
ncbi:hypothetical protein RRF57_001569 [Xylaria bambusicola]|uniref:Uncharacterized protein n=1 Tax=Xylaria bambusicola TaxID=326684 RepID=A0AAN7Z3N4_9PEZI